MASRRPEGMKFRSTIKWEESMPSTLMTASINTSETLVPVSTIRDFLVAARGGIDMMQA